MNRLFILGDSWSFNYFSKDVKDRPDQIPHLNSVHVAGFVKEFDYYGHWTDYLTDYYDVYNFSEGGCCNEDIIHQLGFLPEYKEGDRLIIMFTSPSRFQWMVNEKRKTLINGLYWKSKLSDIEREVYDNQFIMREELWEISDERKNEKQFINNLQYIYKQYKPILTSWNKTMSDNVENIVEITPHKNFVTISYESGGKYDDNHLGVTGNYEMFKFMSNKLGLPTNNLVSKTIVKKII